MSRFDERFGKNVRLAEKRSGQYNSLQELLKLLPSSRIEIDSRSQRAYGGPLCRDSCVQAYTKETPLYKEVNGALTDDTDDVYTHAEFMFCAKRQMKQMWSRGCKFEGEAWRWVELTSGDVAEFYPGREFLWPPFISTSRDQNLPGFNQRNTLFQIDCDGPGLTYAVDIKGVSAFPSEQEVLIYPYSGFTVLDRVDDHRVNGETKTLIRLQVKDTLLVERRD